MKASGSMNLHLVACTTKSVSVGYDFAKSHRIELKFCTQKNFIVRLTFVSMTVISASEGHFILMFRLTYVKKFINNRRMRSDVRSAA